VDLVLPPPLGGEVLAEGPPGERLQLQLAPPIGVVLGRVGVDRLLRTAVDREVGLAVAR
jgi:hypothetical protein